MYLLLWITFLILKERVERVGGRCEEEKKTGVDKVRKRKRIQNAETGGGWRLKKNNREEEGEEGRVKMRKTCEDLIRDQGGRRRRWCCSYPASCPLACACPAMASMMESCEYMLMGVLYWAWMMVALPPGPFTSMGLWVEMAVSFRTLGLKPALLWRWWSGVAAEGWWRRGEVGSVCVCVCEGIEKEKIKGKWWWCSWWGLC